MAEEQAKPKGSPWARRLLIIATGLIALGALLAVVAKYWIIPAIVRSELRSALADVWLGRAELRTVQFNYLSPPKVGGLELYGPAGRAWVQVGDIRLGIRDWPGRRPCLTSIEVDGVQLALHVAGGDLRLPIRRPKPSSGPARTGSEYVDLQSIRVKGISLAVVDDDSGRRSQWRGIELLVARRQGGQAYDVTLNHTAEDGKVAKVLAGTVRAADLQADLRLVLNGQITETNTGMLLALLKVTGVRELAGGIRTDLAITGRLDEPAGLLATGTLALDKWYAGAAEGRVVDELDLTASLKGRTGTLAARVSTPAWSADLPEAEVTYALGAPKVGVKVSKGTVEIGMAGDYGPFWGKLLAGHVIRGRSDVAGDVSYDPTRPRALDFEVAGSPRMQELTFVGIKEHSLRDVSVRQARFGPTRARVTGLTATYAKGRLEADGDAWLAGAPGRQAGLADWARLDRLHAAAKLSLDNIDALVIPILPELIARVSPGADKFGLSDAAAVVNLDKSVVTFQSGRLANPISAMEVEKGGTINLADKRLDFSVIAVPLHVLRSILTKIPLLNLAVDFKDKLIRFRVRGPWTDPPVKLITKEPVKDIAQGTVDFFKGVAETGGQLVPALLKGVTDLFTLPLKLKEMGKEDR